MFRNYQAVTSQNCQTYADSSEQRKAFKGSETKSKTNKRKKTKKEQFVIITGKKICVEMFKMGFKAAFIA